MDWIKKDSTCKPELSDVKIITYPIRRGQYNIRIDRNECNVCIKHNVCNCYLENRVECGMICLGCGICLCHPDRKEHCIDAHYVYNGDFVMCLACYDKHKEIHHIK